ncbi:MAG: ABC-2 transporter permease [Anaerolineae bacterium]|nr:ABC-2 transporter permease [Anaerolineae bacterium]
MTQLRGIIYYELLMSWRRRSLPILILFFLAALLFIGVLVGEVSSPIDSGVIEVRVENGITTVISRADDGSLSEQPLDAEAAQALPAWLIGINLDLVENTLRGIYVLLPALMVMVIGIIPLLSDTIPLDRQYRVRELLDASPLHRRTYLGGKVLSVWSGLLAGISLCLVLYQLVLYLLYGPYDVRPLLLLWIGLVIPLTLFAAAVVVLFTSWAGSRRSGLLAALLLIPIGVYLYFAAAMTLGSLGRLIYPVYGLGLMDTYLTDPNYRSVVLADAAGMLSSLLMIGALVWLAAWGYARLREAR